MRAAKGIFRGRFTRARGRAALVAPALALAIGLPRARERAAQPARRPQDLGAVSSTGGALTLSSLGNELGCIWQLYLPRLPGMTHYFAGLSTWREVWFDHSISFYGWMDAIFPGWVNNVALALATPRRAAVRPASSSAAATSCAPACPSSAPTSRSCSACS